MLRIDNEQYIPTRAAAAYLDLSPHSLRCYRLRGILRGRKIGRDVHFSLRELDCYLAIRRRPGNPNWVPKP